MQRVILPVRFTYGIEYIRNDLTNAMQIRYLKYRRPWAASSLTMSFDTGIGIPVVVVFKSSVLHDTQSSLHLELIVNVVFQSATSLCDNFTPHRAQHKSYSIPTSNVS